MGTRTRIGRTVLSAVLSAALALQCSPAVAEPMAEEPMGAEAAGATTARQAQRTPAAASDGASAVAEEGALAEEPVAVQAPAAQPDAGQPEDAKQTADAGKTTDAKQAPADPAALAPEGEAADDAALAADGALSAQSDDGAIEAQAARPVLHAQAHVQDHGWMAPAAGRSVSVGTEHESRRVESLRLWVTGASGAVEGKVHVQDYGWLGWRASSPTSGLGTDGQSKRVEAMRLRLSSGLASAGWHLYYRLHVQDLGWLGWARDGQLAGTAGYARRAEKVELRLVGPGEAAPGVGQAFRSRGFSGTGHVQDIGWQPERSGTRFSVGTSHQSRRVEAITLNRPGDDRTGDVVYQAHVQNIGWQGEVRNGQAAGTSGRSLRVEAIRVRLTGELERDYDVWYRVHAQDVGWMGWTRNGAKAGTQGYSRRLEAIEVAFLPKGSSTPSAPGQATSQPFMENTWTYAIPGGTFTMPGPWRGRVGFSNAHFPHLTIGMQREPGFFSKASDLEYNFRSYGGRSNVLRTYTLRNGGTVKIAGGDDHYYAWILTMPNGKRAAGSVSDCEGNIMLMTSRAFMDRWRSFESVVTGLPTSTDHRELTLATIRVIAEHVTVR